MMDSLAEHVLGAGQNEDAVRFSDGSAWPAVTEKPWVVV